MSGGENSFLLNNSLDYTQTLVLYFLKFLNYRFQHRHIGKYFFQTIPIQSHSVRTNMPKRQRSLRREISRKAIARRWIGVKGSASKEELFEAKLEEQMEVKVIEEENNNGNDTDIIEK